MRIAAIIPGAGQGLRFSRKLASDDSSHLPKQFQTFADRPLILWTLQPFLKSPIIDIIVVVVPEGSITWIQAEISKLKNSPERSFGKEIFVTRGGATRQDSVRRGIDVLPDGCEIVVVHDAVRQFVQEEWIEKTVGLCSEYDGAIMAIRAKDTLKIVRGNEVTGTLDRTKIWQAQTPQTFKLDVLVSAFKNAKEKGIVATDEAQLVELNGGKVAIVEGTPQNIKITTREDWELAELIWEGRRKD